MCTHAYIILCIHTYYSIINTVHDMCPELQNWLHSPLVTIGSFIFGEPTQLSPACGAMWNRTCKVSTDFYSHNSQWKLVAPRSIPYLIVKDLCSVWEFCSKQPDIRSSIWQLLTVAKLWQSAHSWLIDLFSRVLLLACNRYPITPTAKMSEAAE